jgi:phosphatidylserine/phosphatidylglycerophosphate/cardiolipin synthase-like enzyme
MQKRVRTHVGDPFNMTNWHEIDRATIIDGAQLSAVSYELVRSAKRSIRLVQFLIDIRRDNDAGEVRGLLLELAGARARGVAVSVLLAAPAPSVDLAPRANIAAARLLARSGISVRWYTPTPQRPFLHTKFLLSDDVNLVTGNANWTPMAFRMNAEVGLFVRSSALGRVVAARFARLFRSGRVESTTTQRRMPQAATPSIVRRLRRVGACVIDAPTASTDGSAAILAGQQCASVMRELVQGAQSRIWLAMFGLRTLSSPRLRGLSMQLHEAVLRGVDVRVIFDADPRTADIAAYDVPELLRLGIPVRAWPYRSRLHARALLVDDTALIGSVGWTPSSIFRTEEMTVAVRSPSTTDELVDRFESYWMLASGEPACWPPSAMVWPSAVVAALARAGISNLGQVELASTVPGLTEPEVNFLRRVARWVIGYRFPPAAAWVTARGYDASSCASLQTMTPRVIDRTLRRSIQYPRDLTPVGRYLSGLRPGPGITTTAKTEDTATTKLARV